MIDDLVHLTVSEVPLAYNHPDAEVINSDRLPRSPLAQQFVIAHQPVVSCVVSLWMTG
jgi:hypothetical protein